jgi:hypothetical protein
VWFAGDEVEAAVIFLNAFDDTALGFFVVDGDLDGDLLDFRVGDHGGDVGGGALRMREDPGAAQVLDVANHALLFAAEFGAAGFEPAVEFIEAVLDLLDVGREWLGRVAALLHFEQVGKTEILAVNQLVQADFQVAGDGFRFARTLGGDLGQHGVEGMLDKELLGGSAIRQTITVRRDGAFGRNGQIEQDGGLFDGKLRVES